MSVFASENIIDLTRENSGAVWRAGNILQHTSQYNPFQITPNFVGGEIEAHRSLVILQEITDSEGSWKPGL